MTSEQRPQVSLQGSIRLTTTGNTLPQIYSFGNRRRHVSRAIKLWPAARRASVQGTATRRRLRQNSSAVHSLTGSCACPSGNVHATYSANDTRCYADFCWMMSHRSRTSPYQTHLGPKGEQGELIRERAKNNWLAQKAGEIVALYLTSTPYKVKSPPLS